jgi:hypothetical protein
MEGLGQRAIRFLNHWVSHHWNAGNDLQVFSVAVRGTANLMITYPSGARQKMVMLMCRM